MAPNVRITYRGQTKVPIRGYFLLVLVLATSMSCFRAVCEPQYVQRRALEELQQELSLRDATLCGCGRYWIGPEWLTSLLSIEVKERHFWMIYPYYLLRVTGPRIDDDMLTKQLTPHFNKFSNLKRVEFYETQVTTEGLAAATKQLPAIEFYIATDPAAAPEMSHLSSHNGETVTSVLVGNKD
jgi:hypothetical protein